jgi:hypothetical protein
MISDPLKSSRLVFHSSARERLAADMRLANVRVTYPLRYLSTLMLGSAYQPRRHTAPHQPLRSHLRQSGEFFER